MTKQAERPLTASFIEGSSCTFDSNDFVEFDILTHDLPMGEIVFKGNPFTDAGLTELGRCVYDYCDHGLYVYQYLANMLYEAQHPWLDYADAVERGAFKEKAQYLYLLTNKEDENLDVTWVYLQAGLMKLESYQAKSAKVLAVKPVDKVDFYHFNEVKVWQPLETVL
jgi:hypothetical protein